MACYTVFRGDAYVTRSHRVGCALQTSFNFETLEYESIISSRTAVQFSICSNLTADDPRAAMSEPRGVRAELKQHSSPC